MLSFPFFSLTMAVVCAAHGHDRLLDGGHICNFTPEPWNIGMCGNVMLEYSMAKCVGMLGTDD